MRLPPIGLRKNTELEKENSIRKDLRFVYNRGGIHRFRIAGGNVRLSCLQEQYALRLLRERVSFGLRRTDKHDGRNRRRLRHCGREYSFNVRNPGLGSKTNTRDFLSGYEGKKGKITLGADIDAVSGATISSKGGDCGSEPALALDIDIAAIAEKKGVMLYVSELDTDPPETDGDGGDAPIYQPNQRPNIQSGRVEDTLDYVDGVENPNAAPSAERPKIDIPVQSDTEVYITETETETGDDTDLTPAPPETTTSAPETTTKAPRNDDKGAGDHHKKHLRQRPKRRRLQRQRSPRLLRRRRRRPSPSREETTGSADENEDPS